MKTPEAPRPFIVQWMWGYCHLSTLTPTTTPLIRILLETPYNGTPVSPSLTPISERNRDGD